MLTIPKAASAEKIAYAEWCQCAIFVVNHLGLEIIPGEYYTAGSFVIPDDSGRTWMEYQGFSQRLAGERPQNGDVVVIRPNGMVFVPESGDGSRLMEVNAAWTGHIGVVESSESVTRDGTEYWQLTFLSSNWGVNASPMFVRSNCFNVDRSLVWVEKSDPDFSYWKQTEPFFQRQHILNIARQLANGYYHIGFDGTIDGFPVSGDGMIAYMWNLDLPPDRPIDEVFPANGFEVPPGSIQVGDALLISDEQVDFFRGIYAGGDGGEGRWYETGLAYWFDPGSAVLKGPSRLADLLLPEQVGSIQVFRSKKIVPDLKVNGFEILEAKGGAVQVVYTIRNEGGQAVKIEAASARISSPQGSSTMDVGIAATNGIEIPAGQEFVFISDILVGKSGVYQFQPVMIVNGKNVYFPEIGKVRYLFANQK
ncbi:MAG: hypothetical protein AB9891_16390 [Anaerolineaceae bacterium]